MTMFYQSPSPDPPPLQRLSSGKKGHPHLPLVTTTEGRNCSDEPAIEGQMIKAMNALIEANEAPLEAFERLGLR
jgi:hypothetical protein